MVRLLYSETFRIFSSEETTALHLTAALGEVDVVTYLLDMGCVALSPPPIDPSSGDPVFLPLFAAAMATTPDVFDLFTQRGAKLTVAALEAACADHDDPSSVAGAHVTMLEAIIASAARVCNIEPLRVLLEYYDALRAAPFVPATAFSSTALRGAFCVTLYKTRSFKDALPDPTPSAVVESLGLLIHHAGNAAAQDWAPAKVLFASGSLAKLWSVGAPLPLLLRSMFDANTHTFRGNYPPTAFTRLVTSPKAHDLAVWLWEAAAPEFMAWAPSAPYQAWLAVQDLLFLGVQSRAFSFVSCVLSTPGLVDLLSATPLPENRIQTASRALQAFYHAGAEALAFLDSLNMGSGVSPPGVPRWEMCFLRSVPSLLAQNATAFPFDLTIYGFIPPFYKAGYGLDDPDQIDYFMNEACGRPQVLNSIGAGLAVPPSEDFILMANDDYVDIITYEGDLAELDIDLEESTRFVTSVQATLEAVSPDDPGTEELRLATNDQEWKYGFALLLMDATVHSALLTAVAKLHSGDDAPVGALKICAPILGADWMLGQVGGLAMTEALSQCNPTLFLQLLVAGSQVPESMRPSINRALMAKSSASSMRHLQTLVRTVSRLGAYSGTVAASSVLPPFRGLIAPSLTLRLPQARDGQAQIAHARAYQSSEEVTGWSLVHDLAYTGATSTLAFVLDTVAHTKVPDLVMRVAESPVGALLPIHVALLHGHLECVRLLLDAMPPTMSASDLGTLCGVGLMVGGGNPEVEALCGQLASRACRQGEGEAFFLAPSSPGAGILPFAKDDSRSEVEFGWTHFVESPPLVHVAVALCAWPLLRPLLTSCPSVLWHPVTSSAGASVVPLEWTLSLGVNLPAASNANQSAGEEAQAVALALLDATSATHVQQLWGASDSDVIPVLTRAGAKGYWDLVSRLIECGLSPSSGVAPTSDQDDQCSYVRRGQGGYSLLHHAGAQGCVQGLAYLLDVGCNPVVVDESGRSPVYAAGIRNKNDATRMLFVAALRTGDNEAGMAAVLELAKVGSAFVAVEVAAGVWPDVQNTLLDLDGWWKPVLESIVRSGSVRALSSLLQVLNEHYSEGGEWKAHTGETTGEGLLYTAARFGRVAAAHLLLKAGVALEPSLAFRNAEGESILHWIYANGMTSLLARMESAARDSGEECLALLEELRGDARDVTSLVNYAVGMGNGGMVDRPSGLGWLSRELEANAAGALSSGEDGSSGGAADEGRGKRVDTPDDIVGAAGAGLVDAVRTRLGNGESADSVDGSGTPLVHAAVLSGSLPVLGLVLSSGADPNVVDGRGKSALVAALEAKRGDAAALLIECGANLDGPQGPGGVTPLHVAAAGGMHDVVVSLFLQGVDLEAKDGEGKTAVYYALAMGHVSVVRLLRDEGVAIDEADIVLQPKVGAVLGLEHGSLPSLLPSGRMGESDVAAMNGPGNQDDDDVAFAFNGVDREARERSVSARVAQVVDEWMAGNGGRGVALEVDLESLFACVPGLRAREKVVSLLPTSLILARWDAFEFGTSGCTELVVEFTPSASGVEVVVSGSRIVDRVCVRPSSVLTAQTSEHRPNERAPRQRCE